MRSFLPAPGNNSAFVLCFIFIVLAASRRTFDNCEFNEETCWVNSRTLSSLYFCCIFIFSLMIVSSLNKLALIAVISPCLVTSSLFFELIVRSIDAIFSFNCMISLT